MPIKLYFSPRSPSCQSVLLVGQCLEISFELIEISPMHGETLKPKFLQINPQHTIPTLVDEDDFIVWESRTIARYLSQKYGKNDNLYPNDLKKRTTVDKMLDFDLGTLYKSLMDFTETIFTIGEPNAKAIPKLEEALLVLERCIEKTGSWAAGDTFTIADVCLFMSVNTLTVVNYSLAQYRHMTKWMQSVKSAIPQYDVVGAAAEADFKAFHESLKKKSGK